MLYIRKYIQDIKLPTVCVTQNDNTFSYIVYFLSPPQAKNFLRFYNPPLTFRIFWGKGGGYSDIF